MSASVYDMAARKLEIIARQIPNVDHGGGGGNNGGMEARIAVLEGRISSLDERLMRVETKLGHIDSEVSNIKWYMLGAALTMIVTVLGMGVAIQQMTVTTFEAAAKANSSSAAQILVIPAQGVTTQPAQPPTPLK